MKACFANHPRIFFANALLILTFEDSWRRYILNNVTNYVPKMNSLPWSFSPIFHNFLGIRIKGYNLGV